MTISTLEYVALSITLILWVPYFCMGIAGLVMEIASQLKDGEMNRQSIHKHPDRPSRYLSGQ